MVSQNQRIGVESSGRRGKKAIPADEKARRAARDAMALRVLSHPHLKACGFADLQSDTARNLAQFENLPKKIGKLEAELTEARAILAAGKDSLLAAGKRCDSIVEYVSKACDVPTPFESVNVENIVEEAVTLFEGE